MNRNYIFFRWMFGDFTCRLYLFIQSLSNTASIFILVVICMERYFAILYPISCRQILNRKRLTIIICGVWITCILYSSPKFYLSNTITNVLETENKTETLCVPNREKYNSKLFDIIHFVLFYVVPLIVMSLLYTRIAVCLWNSSKQLKRQLDASSSPNDGLCRKYSARNNKLVHLNGETKSLQPSTSSNSTTPNSSRISVLKARKGVIKMLIVLVCTFAICNLPFHARKMWQNWSSNYQGDSDFSALLTPLTFLCTYFNSAVNPLLYAFLSKNFRGGMREILLYSCPWCRKQQGKKSHITLHLLRRASTRSTMKGNTTTVTIANNDHSSECAHDV
ncbi:hypothetical protein NQ317_003075 [Molorchus minor]|uniref:Thyrotropin-releasing hormone receptor n=1 Tax=Molorchus minor TaxID=1323400 RepID=A0ABQ9JNB3_9CUCU|nr:hypothetical protein NQ317_003075 [Molorchus minor]